jgi:lipopolysaccharide transport system ATP-binding protein
MSQAAVRVHELGKRFRLYRGGGDRVRQLFARNGARYYDEVWALQGLSFEVARGEAFGVIGANGSGKTTLLQLLAGTLEPSCGSLQVQGRVTALLELGSGFHPDLSGRENVYLYGSVLGLRRARIDERLGYVQELAGLGEFFDRPLKTYSSGMALRLGFAVQACTDPDVFIVDEVLSVGDFFFQQKCLSKLRELRERGTTMVIATHDLSIVRDLCPRAVVLRQGQQIFLGEGLAAIRAYLGTAVSGRPSSQSGVPETAASAPAIVESTRRTALWSAEAPPGPGRLIAVAVSDAENEPTLSVVLAEQLRVRVLYRMPGDGRTAHVSVTLKNRWGQIINTTSSRNLGLVPPAASAGEEVLFELALALSLEAGGYSFCVRLIGDTRAALDETPWLGPIEVVWSYATQMPPFFGMFGIPAQGRYLTSGHSRTVDAERSDAL